MLPFHRNRPLISASRLSRALYRPRNARGFFWKKSAAADPVDVEHQKRAATTQEQTKPTIEDTLIIGNRGYCAQRAIRTAKRLGIKTLHPIARGDVSVEMADKTVYLDGQGSAAYLDIPAYTRLSKEHGATWIWPGWGFWSENSVALKQLNDAGITTVAPDYEVVAAVGEKTRARAIAIEAGVPVVPGSDVLPTVEVAREWAAKVEYPVLIKAVSGGGGKGMRVARNEQELNEFFPLTQEEALASFNDGRVFLEKFVEGNIQHVEVQIVGDQQGNVLSFGTRNCSAQRRKQKVVEEAPAQPEYDFLNEAAVKFAKAAGYYGAGTVEFIVESGKAYFMEMNTRLQVEHPVTEAITGVDLVELQLKVAMGMSLPDLLGVKELPMTWPSHGHAIEVRHIKERPQEIDGLFNTFPVPGRFVRPIPPSGPGVRFEGLMEQNGVDEKFDPNFANTIVHDPMGRDACIQRTLVAMEESHFGKDSNTRLAQYVLRHPAFRSFSHHIGWLEKEMQTPDFIKTTMDHENRRENVDKMGKYIAEVSVNGPKMGTVNKVNKLECHAPVPVTAPVPEPKWPLFGEIWNQAGGGAAGASAVVAEWKRQSVTEGSKFQLGNTRDRDWSQTAVANRASPTEQLLTAKWNDRLPYCWNECWGGANPHVLLKFLQMDPVEAGALLRQNYPGQIASALFRDISTIAYGDTPLDEATIREIYRISIEDAGVQKARVFQGMNDPDRHIPAIRAVCNLPAIVDVCAVFNRKYDSEFYARYCAEMYEVCKAEGAADRVIFTIKDAQGKMGVEDIPSMKDFPALLEKYTGSPQFVGIHTHNPRGISSSVYERAAQHGFRFGDVSPEKLATGTTQPPINQIVQLLDGTPYDTQFPLWELDKLAEHDISLGKLYKPLMPDETITAYQSNFYGVPPGMTNNVRLQFLSVGGKPEDFPRFLKFYQIFLDEIFDVTGVTPYSKDAGEGGLWALTNDPDDKLKTTEDVVRWACANAASAPNSVKNLLRSQKGKAQFKFHPEVEKAFLNLPAESVPVMTANFPDISTRKLELERQFGRPVPEYLVWLERIYPGDVEAFLQHDEDWGKYSSWLPLQVKFRGLNPGESVDLVLDGRQVNVNMVARSAPDSEGMVTVDMSFNGNPVSYVVKDAEFAKAGAGGGGPAENVVASPTETQITSPIPGSVKALKFSDGDAVEEGDVIVVMEAMKMQTAIPAKKSGIVRYRVKAGDNLSVKNVLVADIE